MATKVLYARWCTGSEPEVIVLTSEGFNVCRYADDGTLETKTTVYTKQDEDDEKKSEENPANGSSKGNPEHGLTPAQALIVRAANINSTGTQFVVSTEDKRIICYDTESWKPTRRWFAERKVMQLCFSNNGESLLVADKTGDIVRYALSTDNGDDASGSALVTGSLSTITDILQEENRLIFADRDNHIKICRYPAAYAIDSYCLGHTSTPTRLCRVHLAGTAASEAPLLSGGCDGTVRMWNAVSGELLFTVSPFVDGCAEMPVSAIIEDPRQNGIVIAIGEGSAVIVSLVVSRVEGRASLKIGDRVEFKGRQVRDVSFIPSFNGRILMCDEGGRYETIAVDEEGKMCRCDGGAGVLSIAPASTKLTTFRRITSGEQSTGEEAYRARKEERKNLQEQKTRAKAKRLGEEAAGPERKKATPGPEN